MKLVSQQIIGAKSDHLQTKVCENLEEASQLYILACRKLLCINEWRKTANDILQTDFYLCDQKGIEINREPEIHDFIKINLAGPGPAAGDGFDWVQIEEIIVKKENDDKEFTYLRVRPASCPSNETTGIAHFYHSAATTNFIITREKNTVISEIYGRNEVPNKTTNQLADNIRNGMVAKLAALKFSDIQWENLCKGLLR